MSLTPDCRQASTTPSTVLPVVPPARWLPTGRHHNKGSPQHTESRLSPAPLQGAASSTIALNTGCGAAWLARLTGGQEVAGSNPASPTRKVQVRRGFWDWGHRP